MIRSRSGSPTAEVPAPDAPAAARSDHHRHERDRSDGEPRPGELRGEQGGRDWLGQLAAVRSQG